MKQIIIPYKPYEKRTPDDQYRNLLAEILSKGKKKTSFHAHSEENRAIGHTHCLELGARMLRFDLSNGVPISPIRNLNPSYKGAIGEMIGFVNGARTLEDLKSFGCPEIFWRKFVTKEKCAVWGLEEGDLGPGSYGAILTAMPMPDGTTFNQLDAVIKQMQDSSFARTNLLTTWYPPYAIGDKDQGSPRQVVVAPCHGNMVQFSVMDDRTMNMAVYQRSADVPVGLALNLAEWIAFGMMIACVANVTLVEYAHFLPNPQIYDIQKTAAEELISRESRRLPTLTLDPKRIISNIREFRKEDFILTDYDPHEKMIIPTAA